jgi:uncharacterized repeat protein (TIGR03803 family)
MSIALGEKNEPGRGRFVSWLGRLVQGISTITAGTLIGGMFPGLFGIAFTRRYLFEEVVAGGAVGALWGVLKITRFQEALGFGIGSLAGAGIGVGLGGIFNAIWMTPLGGLIGILLQRVLCGHIYDRGTVFRVDPHGVSLVLHHFGTDMDDGSSPVAALLEGKDGVLYGTTSSGGGGFYPSGTVFKLNKDGSDYAVLYRFQGSASLRWEPPAGLIEGYYGLLYGITSYGGTTNMGTVFQLAKDGSGFSVVHSFLGSANLDGSEPTGRLVQSGDGTLYGCTLRGSTAPISPFYPGDGTIFRLATNGAEREMPGAQPSLRNCCPGCTSFARSGIIPL